MPLLPLRPRTSVLLATLLLTPTLAACAEEAAPTASAEADGFPVTVRNCGFEVTLDAPPERIVTVKSTSTELVLALGAGDRVVGHAFPDDELPDELAAAGKDLELISEKAPSQEVVLEREPDLVFAGWESNLEADTAGERDTLARLGVASYVAPSACQSADQPEKMTFDLLFDHFLEAGQLLDAQAEAKELVAEQRAQLESLGSVTPSTTALWWSSGTDMPFVGGGIGAPQMVMEAIGLTNVAAGERKTWTERGWERVVADDPDVIVLVDADWNTAASKIQQLEENPATANLSAVKAKRYLYVPFPAAEAGVRSVDAVAGLLEQARKLGLTDEGSTGE